MKEPWMMFTYNQGKELIDNTTNEWTSINNVNGRKFTSNTNTSKYIFLPAAGSWNKETHEGTGTSALYYTSTASFPFTHSMVVISSQVSLGVGDKYRGQPTRPVAPARPW